MFVVRSLAEQGDCETDSRLHLSTASEPRSIHPKTVLFEIVSHVGAKSGAVSIRRGGIETQG